MGWALAGFGVVTLAAACGRGHFRSHGDLSDEELREKIEGGVEHVLGRADASDEQVAHVSQVLVSAVPDFRVLREERKALTAELQIELRKEQIDRAALEALRVKALGLADRASARAVTALADAASELDAKQRAELIAQWNRHMGS
jgi:hypothetical protein